MPLQIEVSQERSITVIRLRGSVLSGDGVSSLQKSLSELNAEGGAHHIVVDLHDVGAIDESAVQLLSTTQDELKQEGGGLALARSRYPVLATLAIYDAIPEFARFDSVDEAAGSFADAQGGKGVKHFDILEFVKEQEKEMEEQSGE